MPRPTFKIVDLVTWSIVTDTPRTMTEAVESIRNYQRVDLERRLALRVDYGNEVLWLSSVITLSELKNE